MIKKIFLTWVIFCALSGAACAFPAKIATPYVAHAAIVGQTRFKMLMLDIYDIALYAPNGKYIVGKPFILRLDYLRDLKGKDIADRSISEMTKQGFTDKTKLAAWKKQLYQIMPDVKKGVSLTGIYTQSGKTIFYKNSDKIGVVSDPAFGKQFFNIWLGEKTTEPASRAALLNNATK